MKNKFMSLAFAAIAALGIAAPGFAHHGASEYELTEQVTVTGGAVTRFEFVNPHIEIYWETKDDKGGVQKWRAEGTTPNILFRNGWTKDSLKPGTELQLVSGNRCKSAENCMRLRKIVLASGEELPIPQ